MRQTPLPSNQDTNNDESRGPVGVVDSIMAELQEGTITERNTIGTEHTPSSGRIRYPYIGRQLILLRKNCRQRWWKRHGALLHGFVFRFSSRSLLAYLGRIFAVSAMTHVRQWKERKYGMEE